MKPVELTTVAFLKTILPSLLDDEYLELRAFPIAGGPRHQEFFRSPTALLRAAEARRTTHNLFFGVQPRHGRERNWTPNRPNRKCQRSCWG